MQKRGSGSHRIQRVEREIREVIAWYLLANLRSGPSGRLASVSRVIVTRDLRQAKVYVTVMGSPQEQMSFVDGIRDYVHDIQTEVNRKMRMKFCPKLTFLLDDTLEKRVQVDRILREIDSNRHDPSSSDLP